MATYGYTKIQERIEERMMRHLNASEPAPDDGEPEPDSSPIEGPSELSLPVPPMPPAGPLWQEAERDLERDNILVAAAMEIYTKEQALDAILRLRAKNAAWFAKRIFV